MDRVVILVGGISATGKTTIGTRLAEALDMPFFSKDAVKESLFDSIGVGDRAWSHRLSGAAHGVLNLVMRAELRAGRSFVIEANFRPEMDGPKFQGWADEFGFRLAQVLCHARGEVLVRRFEERVRSGERHPGHVDHLNIAAFRDYLLAGRCEPLAVDGPLFEVDTTDFAQVDVSGLVQRIRSALPDAAS